MNNNRNVPSIGQRVEPGDPFVIVRGEIVADRVQRPNYLTNTTQALHYVSKLKDTYSVPPYACMLLLLGQVAPWQTRAISNDYKARECMVWLTWGICLIHVRITGSVVNLSFVQNDGYHVYRFAQ